MTPSMSSGRGLGFAQGPPFTMETIIGSAGNLRDHRNVIRHAAARAEMREHSRETSRAVPTAGERRPAQSRPAHRWRLSPANALDAGRSPGDPCAGAKTTCASLIAASTPSPVGCARRPAFQAGETGIPSGADAPGPPLQSALATCQALRHQHVVTRRCAEGWRPLEPCPRWLSGDRVSLDRWTNVFRRVAIRGSGGSAGRVRRMPDRGRSRARVAVTLLGSR
jgi:hypothetical protein